MTKSASSLTILPTMTCFNDAIEYIEQVAKEDRLRAMRLVLVHAIVLMPDGPDEGRQYAHAWVEEGALVWQGGIYLGQRVYFSCLASEYLPHMRVQDSTRYSLLELYIENRKSGHYGPWKPEYQALCRKADS